jgi:hypothetical protein
VIDWIYGNGLLDENHEKTKHQKANLKQMPMTKIQNSKQADEARDRTKVVGMFRLLDFRI